MNFILTLAFFIVMNFTWASDELSFAYSFTPVDKKFNIDLYELSKHFEEKNFLRLTAFPSGNIPFVHADEVMTSETHPGTIIIKMNLVAPADKQYKIISTTGFHLFHTEKGSMAFYDFTKEEVERLVKGIRSEKVSSIKFFNMFISTAQAADGVPCVQKIKDPLDPLKFVIDHNDIIYFHKKLGECGVAALKGMEGQIEDTFKFFQTLKDNPRKLWDDMKKSYDSLKYFISNFTAELKSFYDSVRGMPIDQLLEIGCKMLGEAIPNLLTMATGVGVGVGTVKIMATIIPKLQRIKNLVITLKKHRLTDSVAKEALSCAL